MAAGPGGCAGTRDAAGPGQDQSTRPVPLQDCPSFAGFLHILMCGPYTTGEREGRPVFCITGACTSCRACVAACPEKNIAMNDDKPARGEHCRLCRACVRACPEQAIRIENLPPDTGNGEGERQP